MITNLGEYLTGKGEWTMGKRRHILSILSIRFYFLGGKRKGKFEQIKKIVEFDNSVKI